MFDVSLPTERRDGERRRRPIWGSRHFWLGGRRQGPRRAGGHDRSCYTDVYDSGVAVNVVMIMGGCVLDALLTLYLLDNGAIEANPLMAAALLLGVRPFVLLKVALTGSCLLLLAMHHRFILYRWLRVQQVLICLAIGYAVLLFYELGLIQLIT
ncbi:DUF5658 family protein [Nitrococcus mobilis]|uniref:DUF5658 domain-containing protein n=1 Tax=Nitrococcus mobilis Nb-231 TaxID=314278 RepID=A4BLG3_9GAMM|nr:DUF5658 family protein [Nitrococcus mobilis]EAR23151.1 hypothetical protein NB231_15063 [Nitrococcus mobilis Nb-231]